jgi:hypothetical protein
MATSRKTHYICRYPQDFHTLAKGVLPEDNNEWSGTISTTKQQLGYNYNVRIKYKGAVEPLPKQAS